MTACHGSAINLIIHQAKPPPFRDQKTMEKILIITGGNKGIGHGILEAYKRNGYRVFSVARSLKLTDGNTDEKHIQFDLGHSELVAPTLSRIFIGLNRKNIEKITLINNAATTGQIGRLETNSPTQIEKAINLNLIAPLILTAGFLQLTAGWKCIKHVINISSGAAIKPFIGLSVYCASKAGIDMVTKSIALEQEYVTYGVKTISVYPGLVDTDMQKDMRNMNRNRFPDAKSFMEFKRNGALAAIHDVGAEILEIDQNLSIENGTILDLDQYRFSSQKMYPVQSSH
jgi:benzil reductase ((S)-benzoin forming)